VRRWLSSKIQWWK